MTPQQRVDLYIFVRDLMPPTFPGVRSDALDWWARTRSDLERPVVHVGDLVIQGLMSYEASDFEAARIAYEIAADAAEEAGVTGCMAECRESAHWMRAKASEKEFDGT